MTNSRIPLKTVACDKNITGVSKGKVIYLRKEGSRAKGGEYFKINKTVGGGGSCVCYEATLLSENKTGRLKEYYPCPEANSDFKFELRRNSENQLVATEKTKDGFLSAREDFVHSYHLLREVMRANKNNADFTTFIPDFSIYYACDAEGNFIEASSAYVFTDPENLTVFEDYVKEIHKHPASGSEHKLVTVLETVATLTECVKILHEKGLLHLDIKPANFGIPERNGKLLTDTVTLFDINTIYSLKEALEFGEGTEGFASPEIRGGRADNRSDIYSIGCTLFNAIIVSDDVDIDGYDKKYYTNIQQLVERSRLITASETNSSVFLVWKLTAILKKCLAEFPEKRYQSCVELIADIEDALTLLYPNQISRKLPASKKLVILDKELDKKNAADSTLMFMYHLYRKPLYEFLGNGDTLNILTVGLGNYGQRFLDCCLPLAQVLGRKINVKAVSADKSADMRDKEIYLSNRPEMKEFFSIDGSVCEGSYGSLFFGNAYFKPGDKKHNIEIADSIVGDTEWHYVFIALGDDSLNKSVAQSFCSATCGNCSVNYVNSGSPINNKRYGNPVNMTEDITSDKRFSELERMAFNAHLVWKSGLNIDLREEKQKYRDEYYHKSSFSNVISINYKLFAMGIGSDDAEYAASEFFEKYKALSDEEKCNAIALEHRRWVCEKICLGWQRNYDLEACAYGPTSDRKEKKHITIVKSEPTLVLKTKKWKNSKWDTASDSELETLDGLDRVSVELHRVYKRRADKLRRECALFDAPMIQLRNISKQSTEASIAFSEWYSCLSLIWNGCANKVREYERLACRLSSVLSDTLPKNDGETAKTLVKLIDRRFEIIIKSMSYMDYKSNDSNLLEYIPFILTNKLSTHMVIPFACETNTDMFGNVAAATIVNPELITYLYHFENAKDVYRFKDAVRYTVSYMKEKCVSSKLRFILTYADGEKTENAVIDLKEELKGDKTLSVIQNISLNKISDESDIAIVIEEKLGSRVRVDCAEQNDTALSFLLTGAGFYGRYPKYRFDMNTMKFKTVKECDFLQYIKAKQYLKITDMFASKNSKGYLETPSAFYNDYEALWKECYRGKEFAWKKMCAILSKYHETSDRLATLNFDSAKDSSRIRMRFLLPAEAFDGANKIINALEETNVIDEESEVYYYTTDSCEVNIYAPSAIEAKIKNLFADPYVLCDPDSIDCLKTTYSIGICYDSLFVRSLDLSAAGKHAERIKSCIKLLEDKFSFISNYSESADDPNIISFTYATKRIKKLLTVAGNILEIYIYHKCLSSGRFDDVATSYEISWDGTAVKSEFDVLVTKGFAGLMIEAKAVESIEQDFYFKLSCLAAEFGTNCKAVLIADTVEKKYNDNSGNEMQRMRGDMLDVVTVSDPRQIDCIDKTLADILKGDAEPAVSTQKDAQIPDEPKKIQAPIEHKPSEPSKKSELTAAPSANSPKKKMTREEFLARKISVCKFEQRQLSLLQSKGIKTVGDFLACSEEALKNMKTKNGVSYGAQFILCRERLNEELKDI